MDRYETLQKVGEGTYGVVHKARDKRNNDLVALKKIRLDTDDEGLPSAAIREITLLKQLRHQNIVHLRDLVHFEKKLVLVFEYMDQDLNKFLQPYRNGETLDTDIVKSLMRQLLAAVAYCHYHRVLHRDLKPQNILISIEGPTLKLADFGLARTYGIPVRNYKQEVVTLWYRAPDILLGSIQYSTHVDIWSIGCIFAELVTGQPLFFGVQTNEEQLGLIFKTMGTPDAKKWPDMVNLPGYNPNAPFYEGKPLYKLVPGLDEEGLDLLSKMLEYNPERRISAEAALEHKYLVVNKHSR